MKAVGTQVLEALHGLLSHGCCDPLCWWIPRESLNAGGIIAVGSSEILHQQGLYSCSKLINADFTCIDHNVVIVVVGSNSDVSDMPWVCLQFFVAAVSQKLLPYNILAF